MNTCDMCSTNNDLDKGTDYRRPMCFVIIITFKKLTLHDELTVKSTSGVFRAMLMVNVDES